MHIFIQSLKRQSAGVRNYPLAAGLGFAICFIIIAHHHHDLLQCLAYLLAMWLSAFATDIIVSLKVRPAIGFPVKRSIKRESVVILICTFLGLIGLSIRFFSDWRQLTGFSRLAVLPLFLFIFPVVLTVIYLFIYRYSFKELGVNARYWYLALFVHVIIGGATLLLAPEKSHCKDTLQSLGLADLLFTGIVTAALSEEFVRMLLQTRLGLLFQDAGLGLVVATIIWAIMHIPALDQHHKTEGLSPAIFGAIDIMPIGFLWGYITYRTKSLLPSVLIHGFNLWGLQNF